MIDEQSQKLHDVNDFDIDRWYTFKERALKNMLRLHNLPDDPNDLRKMGYEIIFINKQGQNYEEIKLCKVVDSIPVQLVIEKETLLF